MYNLCVVRITEFDKETGGLFYFYVRIGKHEDENSYYNLLKQQSDKTLSSSTSLKANSEVQQRLKNLQKPAASARRSMSDGIMQQQDYSPSDLQALNNYYADQQAKMEVDAKFFQLINSKGCRSGRVNLTIC